MLKPLLEKVLIDFPPAQSIDKDPIYFPRQFFNNKKQPSEIEAVALFSAMIAYGSAKLFMNKIQEALDTCNGHFLQFMQKDKQFSDTDKYKWPGYRMSTSQEIAVFAHGVGAVIKNKGSLKKVFLSGYLVNKDLREGITALRSAIVKEAEKEQNPLSRGVKHLLPDPALGGCLKRWCMFLRWMVREDDGVDMHLWPEVSTEDLVIPVDRHISQIARHLGLTERTTDNWKSALEITSNLKKICPKDPIKYDFALCHLGMSGECTHGKTHEPCEHCVLAPCCSMKAK